MASDSGFGRKIAKFFGVNLEDEYERPPISSYEERNDAYMNARGRSHNNGSRSLPAGGRSTAAAAKRSVYGEEEYTPGGRYGFDEDDDTLSYRRPGYEPRYSYSADSSSAPARKNRPGSADAPRRNVSSRFVEEPPRRNLPAPAPSRPARRSEQTVMFELYELRDANKVISALVQGNTIIFTIVNPDPRM